MFYLTDERFPARIPGGPSGRIAIKWNKMLAAVPFAVEK
jgi:hypothetical protein